MNPSTIEVAFVVSPDSTKSPVVELVTDETSATEIIPAFDVNLKAADYEDSDDAVCGIDALFERLSEKVFTPLRKELPFIIRFKGLIDARPRNPQTHKLVTPFRGCYSWSEICVAYLQRDPRTVNRLFQDVKSPAQLAAEKAARIHAQHVAANAANIAAALLPAAPQITDTAGNVMSAELTAKVLAQIAAADAAKAEAAKAEAVAAEAVAGRTVAVETARQDGFADGVSAKQEFEEKLDAAAGTVTTSFYTLFDTSDPLPNGEEILNGSTYGTLAEAQKDLKAYKYGGYGVLRVDAVYTLTPCELPSAEPSPKKSKKKSPAVEPAV
jgi:hypothetical protein